MTDRPNHLVLAASDGRITEAVADLAEEALKLIVEEVMAERIMDGEHLWNPETDMVIATARATGEVRREVELATLRHLRRVSNGEPLLPNVQRMQDACRRVSAKRAEKTKENR